MKTLCVVSFSALLAVTGCADTQMFVTGDLQNSIAINEAAGNVVGMECSTALLPAAMAAPAPKNEGVFTLLARKMAVQAAFSPGRPCSVIAGQFALSLLGKAAPFPFNLFAP